MTNRLHDITTYLDTLLENAGYSDMAVNGLQVESPAQHIARIAFAVDSGASVIEKAVRSDCQLLVVHHGVLWGACAPLTGSWGKKVATMMTKGLSLYAAHLPLDGHLVHGNAAGLAAVMGLTELEPAFEYKGRTIGVKGALPDASTLEGVGARFASIEGLSGPLVLPFGKRTVKTVGIVTGSGSSFVPEARARGLDLFVTGEPKQELYHTARDLEMNVVCVGHYASETFGVRSLQRVLQERFRVETTWISEPTGI